MWPGRLINADGAVGHVPADGEVGYLSLGEVASDQLFQFINKAYENVSLVVTSNLDFSDRGILFASPSTATAVLDRLLHHAHAITLCGDSYRVRSRLIPRRLSRAKEE